MISGAACETPFGPSSVRSASRTSSSTTWLAATASAPSATLVCPSSRASVVDPSTTATADGLVAPRAAEMAERSAPQHATAARRPSPLICAVLLSCGIMLLAAAAEMKAASAHTRVAIVAAEISSMACGGGEERIQMPHAHVHAPTGVQA